MNRRPSHRHLSDTKRGQKRPCKPMRHAFLTGKQKPTGICTPPDTRLSTDLHTFRKPTIHDSEPDANICNRGCKYLQVRLQTFASGNSSIHRHEKMPSPYPIFMSTGPHTWLIWTEKMSSKQPQKRPGSPSEGAIRRSERTDFLHKKSLLCSFSLQIGSRTHNLPTIILQPICGSLITFRHHKRNVSGMFSHTHSHVPGR